MQKPGLITQLTVLAGAWVLLGGARLFSQDSAELRQEYFERKVRPLLVERCLECHSTETETNGGLSLDSKVGWSTGGDSGPAINVADWQKSLLWIAVDYRNLKLQMPPDSKLSDAEKEVIRTWLSTGAFDPREPSKSATPKTSFALSVEGAQSHWAYRAPMRGTIPPLENHRRRALDAFLGKAQADVGVEPSDSATSSVLFQRLSVDLHGIRPVANQADEAFVGYEDLVDSMLASPRFGERFARHWMDAVRFAESITLRGFVLPDAWRYRNYLIESFNSDKPVNQFIREQVAGDLMNAENLKERQSQLVATTALAVGDTNLEEQDKKQLEMDYVDEQLELIGKVFLAQTIGCARCHDHKFDPIPTRDYYALAGIMKSSVALEHSNVSKWISVPLPLASEAESRYKDMSARHVVLKTRSDQLKKQIQAGPGVSLVVKVEDLMGIVVDDVNAKKVGEWESSTSVKAYVGNGYLHDKNSGKGSKSVTFEPSDLKPGTYKVRLAYNHSESRTKSALVRIFSADGEDVVRVNQSEKPVDDGLWQTLGTYRFEQGGQAFVMISNEGTKGHVIADAVQFLPDAPPQAASLATESSSSEVKALPKQTELESLESLRKESLAIDEELKSLRAELDARPMVMSFQPSESPADIAIHVRGSVHQQGTIVPRGFLSCVSAVATPVTIDPKSNGRLELANWLANDSNPLTARVYVNRVWSWLMGDGLVRSIDNFGTTGEQPSNPELLDWLTLEFIQHDWSTKWLVREIVLSDAYMRSSKATKLAMELDPDNRLFARSNVRRLDAETIRDTLLSISGELDLAVQIESTIPDKTKEDYGFKHVARYRSVYGPWFRNALPELYTEFDGANPSFPISKRNRSTIAPQALAMLNSEWIAERAHQFGLRLASETGLSEEQRVNTCFLATLSRLPSSRETKWAEEQIRQARKRNHSQATLWSSLVHDLIASLDFRYIE
ncbi:MAG: DUF1553 domain-containing protein [Planctomycetota bacterium]|nr:DUF1553 domain-containing protein [Planctomycetota bacterium]